MAARSKGKHVLYYRCAGFMIESQVHQVYDFVSVMPVCYLLAVRSLLV